MATGLMAGKRVLIVACLRQNLSPGNAEPETSQ